MTAAVMAATSTVRTDAASAIGVLVVSRPGSISARILRIDTGAHGGACYLRRKASCRRCVDACCRPCGVELGQKAEGVTGNEEGVTQ